MGRGTVGQDKAKKCAALGFPPAGWSRTAKTLPGVETFHGAEGLAKFLARSDILVVVVPLIVPLGALYGIHPVHLGIIFLANLELGFLTPLVGLNIFLASYRFKRPILEVCRAALPMMAILGVGVLLITYIPWLTLGILRWLGRV